MQLELAYRVRHDNSLLELEKRAALGSTSQCSPVLPSNPFPVGHSVAELGIELPPCVLEEGRCIFLGLCLAGAKGEVDG